MAVNPAGYYRSIDDANAYFANQLFATDWTGASDVSKQQGLLAAARAIDSLQFKGEKVPVFDLLDADANAPQASVEAAEAEQTKEWPRDGDFFAPDTPSTVQTLITYTTAPTAGNITVKITLSNGTTFTTAEFAFDATAATIQTAIDVAATGVVTAWTNGDIVVTGGPLDTTNVVLTFSGDSVKDRAHSARPVVVGNATFLTDGILAVPEATATVTGECPDRVFFAQCEEAQKLISGRDAEQEFENLVLNSDGVSATRVSSDRSQMPPKHTSHMFTSSKAWKYLQEFLDDDNQTFNLARN